MVTLPTMQTAADVDYGEDQAAMEAHREAGTARALAMGNRGPLQLDENGRLERSILDAYSQYGFYIFEGVLGTAERAELEHDLHEMLDNAPATLDAIVDRHGRPALGADCAGRTVTMVKPLSDPLGGTDANRGRHPVKMAEPTAPEGAPDYVMQLVLGSLQFSPAHLRLYGHPQLLAAAASIHGDDFVPFNESIWIKHPRLGGSVAWHQDGWTHWESPDLNENSHGFNMMAQLYGCDAENGLWIVPGTHRQGKVDIKAMVAAAGSDRLPNAVPLVCAPGDIAITNRQAVHGSFANTSPNMRVTFNLGFHRRKSVLNVEGGGVHNDITVYDADYIRERSRMIMYGIDARRQRYPEETPYDYAPLREEAETLRWSPEIMPQLKDYNLKDLGI
ncbi:MAG: phytanoyl-CoA dioxygenase family protein [Hyphomicrobiaceae bacterium]